MNEYRVGKWERKRMVPKLWKEAELEVKAGSEEQADVGALLASSGFCGH